MQPVQFQSPAMSFNSLLHVNRLLSYAYLILIGGLIITGSLGYIFPNSSILSLISTSILVCLITFLLPLFLLSFIYRRFYVGPLIKQFHFTPHHYSRRRSDTTVYEYKEIPEYCASVSCTPHRRLSSRLPSQLLILKLPYYGKESYTSYCIPNHCDKESLQSFCDSFGIAASNLDRETLHDLDVYRVHELVMMPQLSHNSGHDLDNAGYIVADSQKQEIEIAIFHDDKHLNDDYSPPLDCEHIDENYRMFYKNLSTLRQFMYDYYHSNVAGHLLSK